MFSNLLANAIKYSPAGGLIRIEAACAAEHVAVAVDDCGIGIPDKDIAQLFARYFRGSNVSGIVGTGVGLYLARMVIELHGGSVAVDSREGRGSRFTVRLPLRPAGPDVASRAALRPVPASAAILEGPAEHAANPESMIFPVAPRAVLPIKLLTGSVLEFPRTYVDEDLKVFGTRCAITVATTGTRNHKHHAN